MKTVMIAFALSSVVVADSICSEHFSQCDGQNWPFGVCCKDPNYQCNKKNEYLSLCEPKTIPPETMPPATNPPATSAPPTNPPTTSAPPTNPPTTSAPTTNLPPTNPPTTSAPTTNAPAPKLCADDYSMCGGLGSTILGDCCKNPKFSCNKKNNYLSLCEPRKLRVLDESSQALTCAENYSQCNGQNWPFGVCCKDPNFQCNKKSDSLSVCEPKPARNCADNYSQCNGKNWPFDVCCKDPNFTCNRKNEYLSLCEPKTFEMAQEAVQVQPWEQCGGDNYKGDTSCTAGYSCVEVSNWYHQCQPTPLDANQLPTWSQCGGSGFESSGTTCRDEDYCYAFTPNFSQCIPKQ